MSYVTENTNTKRLMRFNAVQMIFLYLQAKVEMVPKLQVPTACFSCSPPNLRYQQVVEILLILTQIVMVTQISLYERSPMYACRMLRPHSFWVRLWKGVLDCCLHFRRLVNWGTKYSITSKFLTENSLYVGAPLMRTVKSVLSLTLSNLALFS
jgi:hypothetical protein